MWAYIPEEEHDGENWAQLTVEKRYRIKDVHGGAFLITDDFGYDMTCWFCDCPVAGDGWRIVLKPRIRRLGVVG